MTCYRIYVVSRGKQLVDDVDAECRNDYEACVLAESMLKPGTQAEIWQGTKLIRLLSLVMTVDQPRRPGADSV